MFEVRIQTYWADFDAAGIAYYSHYFRFVESAEEELFRASGIERQALLDKYKVWLPRVETFAKFVKPIYVGDVITVRLSPQFRSEKSIKCVFEIVKDASKEVVSEGYVTIVCVNRESFKARELPKPLQDAFRIYESRE